MTGFADGVLDADLVRHRSRDACLENAPGTPTTRGARVVNGVRSAVAASWARSAAAGVDPDAQLAPRTLDPDAQLAPRTLDPDALAETRSAHPLSQVFPLLYDVLGRAAEDCDCVMAIGDASGQLLWVCGPPAALARVERINFVEGAAWDEVHAGTNAPAMAQHLDAAVGIHAAEHFNRLVQP